jgi:hypothetical protein
MLGNDHQVVGIGPADLRPSPRLGEPGRAVAASTSA